MPRSTQRRAGTPGQLSPADNLEAILVVDTILTMTCQSAGNDHLLPGQWVVSEFSHGSVHDYGAVLRRQSRPSLLGWELPSFLRPHRQRRIVLPSMRDVLSLPTDDLGEQVATYSIVPDKNREKPTEHVFSTQDAFDDRDPIFRGSTPPTPTFWLPEFITNPVFIAPMAADVAKEVAIKAYRLWGSLEEGYNGVCLARDGNVFSPSLHYRALFLLYGRGNAIRDHQSAWSSDPVCQEPATKVSTGARRAGASSKLAFLARHKARTTV
ncbi:MAG: hypothetical protein M1826_004118 [Phylliscum demangeonii]|nr:MAG: hypothetical protein M1826_004118 [Phylliscum demangeonii]